MLHTTKERVTTDTTLMLQLSSRSTSEDREATSRRVGEESGQQQAEQQSSRERRVEECASTQMSPRYERVSRAQLVVW